MDIPVSSSNSARSRSFVKTGIVLSALIVAAIVASLLLDPAMPSVKQNDVWISEVRQGEFTRKVRGVGVLVPAEIRWIAANSAGRVERILVKPGAVVNTNTVIAEMSNPQLHNQLKQAEWERDAAQANLVALEAQLQEQTLEQTLAVTQARMALEAARLKERAEQPLADKRIISELDFAATQLNTQQREAELEMRLQTQQRRGQLVEARLAAERAVVRKYQNIVSHFDQQLSALKITSDIDGVLQQVSVDVGQRVDVGSNIARVANPDSLLAELQVQENLVPDLRLNLPVTIDTRNGLVEGVVKRIDPRVHNGNVQVDVELRSALPPGVRPDLSVTGAIVVEHIAQALYIDRPSGAQAQSEARLFKLDPARGVAEQQAIRLGKASVSTIEVVAGLNHGDAVIVSDTSHLNQHSVIKLVN